MENENGPPDAFLRNGCFPGRLGGMEGDFCSAARAGTASVRANSAAASTAIPPDACRYRAGDQERVAPGAGGCGGDRQEGELRPGPRAEAVSRVGR